MSDLRQLILDQALVQSTPEKPILMHNQALSWTMDFGRFFSNANNLMELIKAMTPLIKPFEGHCFVGTESKAIPLMTGMVLTTGLTKKCAFVRNERSRNGLRERISGVVSNPAILIDDVLNAAGTADYARYVLRQEGVNIKAVVCIIDYHSKRGEQWRKTYRIPVISLFSLSDLGLSVKA